MLACLRLAPQFEGTELAERDRQPHRYLHLARFAPVAQDGDERRVLAPLVSGRQRHEIAGSIRSDAAAVEREGNGPVGDDGEWMIEARHRAFLRAAREHADGGYGLIAPRSAQTDVI